MSESSPISSPSTGTQTHMDTPDTTDHSPTRRPLQQIQAVPPNRRPPPITAISSPLGSITTSKSMGPPTPPTTPLRRHKRSSTSVGSISLEGVTEETVLDAAIKGQGLGMAEAIVSSCVEKSWARTMPRVYTKQYRRHAPDRKGTEEFGRGVWSVVYRSVELPAINPTAPLTPPTSPMDASPLFLKNNVLAVKAPSRRDAHSILDHEARILTYLHSFPQAPDYLVPFYGYDQSTHSIILSALPLNLDMHVRAAAATTRANVSTRTMFDPIIDVKEWSSLAMALISGLSFLHCKQCIHGDIKPANILLRPSEEDQSYTPLYCDFSSSLVTTEPKPSEITALTQDYSSPELLSSLTDPVTPTLPTSAADVYALAVTLLFAAIGESPYASAKLEIMKLSMAKEGRPLQFAKSGEQAARVRKGGIVERCLAGALAKDVKARWGVAQWRHEVGKVLGPVPNL